MTKQPTAATFRDVIVVDKINRIPVKPGDIRNGIESIEIGDDITSEDLNHVIVRCADILRARAEMRERCAYEQGYKDAQKELVHEPDNPEGITGDELSHQVYGYEFGYKEAIDKACIWLSEHIERKTFNGRYILDISIDEFRDALEGSAFVRRIKNENQPIDFKKIRVIAGTVLKDGKWPSNFSPCKKGYSVLTIGDLLRVTKEEFMKHPMAGNKVWNIFIEDRGKILRELNHE